VIRAKVARARGRTASSLTAALRQDRLLARVGAGPRLQIASLPGDISDLVDQVVTVETSAIRWGGRPPGAHQNRGLAILGGDWDLDHRAPIGDYLATDDYGASIHELFVEGLPYRETAQYAQMVARLEAGDTPKRCTSMAEVDAYFDHLREAYDSIRREGYKPQTELAGGRADDEIMVYVDRDGELHKRQGSGHHRLAIARLLVVEHVPVCILGIHQRWAERCHQKFGGDVVAALRRYLREELSVRPPPRPPPRAGARSG
jgi:hypothetical protein